MTEPASGPAGTAGDPPDDPPGDSPPPKFVLQAIPVDHLALIAAQQPLPADVRVAEGGLLPHFVAQRVLAQLAEGQPAAWCQPFHLVHAPSGVVVGACSFKHPPVQGVVEIGYSVAPAWRRQGAATAAVRALLDGARAGGARGLLGLVNPANTASSALLQRLGFVPGEVAVDEDGEPLRAWLATL